MAGKRQRRPAAAPPPASGMLEVSEVLRRRENARNRILDQTQLWQDYIDQHAQSKAAKGQGVEVSSRSARVDPSRANKRSNPDVQAQRSHREDAQHRETREAGGWPQRVDRQDDMRSSVHPSSIPARREPSSVPHAAAVDQHRSSGPYAHGDDASLGRSRGQPGLGRTLPHSSNVASGRFSERDASFDPYSRSAAEHHVPGLDAYGDDASLGRTFEQPGRRRTLPRTSTAAWRASPDFGWASRPSREHDSARHPASGNEHPSPSLYAYGDDESIGRLGQPGLRSTMPRTSHFATRASPELGWSSRRYNARDGNFDSHAAAEGGHASPSFDAYSHDVLGQLSLRRTLPRASNVPTRARSDLGWSPRRFSDEAAALPGSWDAQLRANPLSINWCDPDAISDAVARSGASSVPELDEVLSRVLGGHRRQSRRLGREERSGDEDGGTGVDVPMSHSGLLFTDLA